MHSEDDNMIWSEFMDMISDFDDVAADSVVGTKVIQVVDDNGDRMYVEMYVYNWNQEVENRKEMANIEECYPNPELTNDIISKYVAVSNFIIDTYVVTDSGTDDFLSDHSFETVINIINKVFEELKL